MSGEVGMNLCVRSQIWTRPKLRGNPISRGRGVCFWKAREELVAARVFWLIVYLEQKNAFRRRERTSPCHSFFPRRRGASARRGVRSSDHHGQASPSYWYRSGNYLQVGAIDSLSMLLQDHPTRLPSQHWQLQCVSFQNICTIFWQLCELLARQALTWVSVQLCGSMDERPCGDYRYVAPLSSTSSRQFRKLPRYSAATRKLRYAPGH